MIRLLVLCLYLLVEVSFLEAKQLIVATAPNGEAYRGSVRLFTQKDNGTWQAESEFIPTLFGKSGFAWGRGLHEPQPGLQKKEGDGRTPAGRFRIGLALGYEPKLPEGAQKWPYHRVTDWDAWIDDPKVPHYNHLVTVKPDAVPPWFESQRMRLGDNAYHWLVLIEHNYTSVEPGAGSAIFFHVRRGEDRPTHGCTAMEKGNLERMIRWLDPKQKPEVVQLAREDYLKLWKAWKLPPPEIALSVEIMKK